ncbi:Importin-9 [Nymphaea thermarum]|nr:Importin-9 [Nymphaea thermarum]
MEGQSVAMDRDQQWLLNCLTATLDPNQDVRSFAEASLKEASSQPVLLKQFVKQHWQEDDTNYTHPLVPPMEKVTIRNLLLLALDDSHGKICTAASMAVASIAQYDWPEEWPELMPFLLNLITDRGNIHAVHGGLRCLALLSGDLDDSSVPRLVQLLFPHLHTIVSSNQIYNKHMRTKALSIVHSCISTLGSMTGVYKSETRELMVPMFKAWMEQFSSIMQAPVQSEDPDDWGIRMERHHEGEIVRLPLPLPSPLEFFLFAPPLEFFRRCRQICAVARSVPPPPSVPPDLRRRLICAVAATSSAAAAASSAAAASCAAACSAAASSTVAVVVGGFWPSAAA